MKLNQWLDTSRPQEPVDEESTTLRIVLEALRPAYKERKFLPGSLCSELRAARSRLSIIQGSLLQMEQQIKTGATLNLIFNTEIVFYRLCKIMTHFRSAEWLNGRWERFLNCIGRLIVKEGTP